MSLRFLKRRSVASSSPSLHAPIGGYLLTYHLFRNSRRIHKNKLSQSVNSSYRFSSPFDSAGDRAAARLQTPTSRWTVAAYPTFNVQRSLRVRDPRLSSKYPPALTRHPFHRQPSVKNDIFMKHLFATRDIPIVDILYARVLREAVPMVLQPTELTTRLRHRRYAP